ncbi:ubiquinol-cytochrome c reductase iron-sulfur subunit [Cocleimonas flava]|uniref:Ubiquinol-cytochrome c reductase iron-sulfur subunit n=1 Tax=Cocleimonas flava TaxID=634765 RepID=A0A4R1ENS1_9GAMM|nr:MULTISPECIES: ubiquinol-cytochrome c reductase iron-sulfur subunit [Cocleimonas]MEB8433146.1 ubiquinol-cytochrome c reductase iron-sulfur subunit [Cocleimonas sp. KMM 6892]MEC4715873.1 ubiquinol-cytochrome c reductase iron-sulfur subunit [Cocleimonas sp. KMM 6895]MEC4745334.1 ubiquinol-cytochrome c reductase iron-sulfur subunit [Cocleimonas sp. KMM 6896]TCJ82613.1 ubiquinol-cytochrome c reductase iron-sulfur subunit [Cocleimonas flava]
MSDSDSNTVDKKRRRMLIAATAAVGAVGTAGFAAPLLISWMPSARAKAAGAPVEVNISKIEPGQLVRVIWRGKPVWFIRRSEETLKNLPSNDPLLADPESSVEAQQPAYAKNADRSIKPEMLVLIGICTHLGCSPTYRPELAPADLGANWKGGFYCPCHGSRFDLAGRVFKNVPAPTNLVVPPYYYKSDDVVLVGEDGGAA